VVFCIARQVDFLLNNGFLSFVIYQLGRLIGYNELCYRICLGDQSRAMLYSLIQRLAGVKAVDIGDHKMSKNG